MNRKSIAAAAALFAAVLAACGVPKYVDGYRSVFKDYKASVPWGWNVMTDGQGPGYHEFAETRFFGPFDGDFFLGLPTFSVRWYQNHRAHVLRDGSAELYSNSDDFIAQTLRGLYGFRDGAPGKARLFLRDPQGSEYEIKKISDIPTITLTDSNREAKLFIIHSPVAVSPRYRWGLEVDRETPAKLQKPYNMRMHAYVVVPMPEGDGFYVFCYPATVRGFNHDWDRFQQLLSSFHPLTAGPAGPKVVLHRAN
jgi:hypothetical protein